MTETANTYFQVGNKGQQILYAMRVTAMFIYY